SRVTIRHSPAPISTEPLNSWGRSTSGGGEMSVAARPSHKQNRLRPVACEDIELVTASRAGNQAAFAELWRRHYEIAISITRPLAPDDADDIVAEAFASIWDRLQHGTGPTEHFRAYLVSTCRNMAARTYRDRQRTV